MKRTTYTDLPLVNRNIRAIIDEKYHGNINLFAREIGLNNSVKINRLFHKDKRNGCYPLPSGEILNLISQRNDISLDFLYGKEMEKNVNNINIESNKINGNSNILGNGNVVSENDYILIIKKQQEQIDALIDILKNK